MTNTPIRRKPLIETDADVRAAYQNLEQALHSLRAAQRNLNEAGDKLSVLSVSLYYDKQAELIRKLSDRINKPMVSLNNIEITLRKNGYLKE